MYCKKVGMLVLLLHDHILISAQEHSQDFLKRGSNSSIELTKAGIRGIAPGH